MAKKKVTKAAPEKDFALSNHGSVVLVTPRTDAARAWVDENVHLESWQWLGNAFACEPRAVDNLLSAAQAEGLTV